MLSLKVVVCVKRLNSVVNVVKLAHVLFVFYYFTRRLTRFAVTQVVEQPTGQVKTRILCDTTGRELSFNFFIFNLMCSLTLEALTQIVVRQTDQVKTRKPPSYGELSFNFMCSLTHDYC